MLEVLLTATVPVVTPPEMVTGPTELADAGERDGAAAGVAELVVARGIVRHREPRLGVGQGVAVGGEGDARRAGDGLQALARLCRSVQIGLSE